MPECEAPGVPESFVTEPAAVTRILGAPSSSRLSQVSREDTPGRAGVASPARAIRAAGLTRTVTKRSDPESTAGDLFKAIGDGIFDANISYEYPLKDAVKAHEAPESNATLGATALIP